MGKRGPMSAEHKARIAAWWTDERRQRVSEYNRGKLRGGEAAGQYIEQGYRYLTMQHDHPLANKSGNVAEHRKVLYDAIGEGPHECHWDCGKTLGWDRITADHLSGNRLDNRLENLVPSCRECNNARRHAGNPINWSADERCCTRGHLMHGANLYLTASGGRYCRTCRREYRRRQRAWQEQ